MLLLKIEKKIKNGTEKYTVPRKIEQFVTDVHREIDVFKEFDFEQATDDSAN